MGKKNPVVHLEFRSKDKGRLQNFYSSLFSWKFKDFGAEYTVIDFGAKDSGGGIQQIGEGQPMPSGVANYVLVEELGPYEEKIKAIGGQILMSNQEIPGTGSFTVFTDIDGNHMGLYRPAAKPKAAKKQAKKAEKAAKKQAKKAAKAAKKAEKKAKKQSKKA
jgi:predicted enzyme related to lactoylglutathione lyase